MASYTVKSGDTLSAIAAQHGVSVADIAAANGIENPDLIYPGQTFEIPSPQNLPLASNSEPFMSAVDQFFSSSPADELIECCPHSELTLTAKEEEDFASLIDALGELAGDVKTVDDVLDLAEHFTDAFHQIGIDPELIPLLVSLILDLIPVVGDIKAGAQAATGYDLITEEPVNRWFEGGLAIVGGAATALGGIGSTIVSAIGRLPKIGRAGDGLKTVVKSGAQIVRHAARGKAFERKVEGIIGTLADGGNMARQLRVKHGEGYKIVDGYLPGEGIFSMYHSKLADHPAAAKAKIREAVKKYSPGTEISSVKSGDNVDFVRKNSQLEGQLFLVVPDQDVPQELLTYAADRKIKILTESDIVKKFGN